MQGFQRFQAAAVDRKLQGREATLDQVIKENESLKQLISRNEQQMSAIQSELVQLRTQTAAHQYKLDNLPAQPNMEWQQTNYENAGNRLEKQVKQLKELFHSFKSSPVIDSKELFQSLGRLVEQVKNKPSSVLQDPSQCIAQLYYEQQALSALVSVHNLWLTSIQNRNSPPETMEAVRSYLDWIRETCNEIYSMTQLTQKQCWDALGIEATTSHSLPNHMDSNLPQSSSTTPRKSTNPFDD
ncbi:hypothetical protein GpartN1_g5016.t1 [Galdieria partita]|uniref:Uncharacterized protein n=1 Tax=Galdieria partita TaxID=83374 RepID=A0A9C7US45_9RHOD|nr:hypothetical protein GpartN1_g5016.t1 [Galdieria partita]